MIRAALSLSAEREGSSAELRLEDRDPEWRTRARRLLAALRDELLSGEDAFCRSDIDGDEGELVIAARAFEEWEREFATRWAREHRRPLLFSLVAVFAPRRWERRVQRELADLERLAAEGPPVRFYVDYDFEVTPTLEIYSRMHDPRALSDLLRRAGASAGVAIEGP